MVIWQDMQSAMDGENVLFFGVFAAFIPTRFFGSAVATCAARRQLFGASNGLKPLDGIRKSQ
jgi:hypothetical protein